MKTLGSIMLVMLLATISFAQTSVDRVVERLEFLGKGSIDDWKYAVNPAGDPSRPDYDDSQWQTLKLNQSIYPDSCWIRRVVVLPERLLGEQVRGIVRFLVWASSLVSGFMRSKRSSASQPPGERGVIQIE